MNPVARGDLSVRLGSPRGIRIQTAYLVVCTAFLLLSLPPEIGRIELRDANLLLAFLIAQLVVVTYLSSSIASAELAVEGEKGLPDLAISAFSAKTVAMGKVTSSAAYAAYLVVIALPLVVLAATLRASPVGPLLAAAALSVAVATAAGVWGAWLAGRFTSDFSRSFVHWVGLAAVLGAAAWLPAPWSTVSPLRAVDEVLRAGVTGRFVVAVGVYLLLAASGGMLIRAHMDGQRAHEDAQRSPE